MTKLILILAGFFTVGMAIANADWYFETYKARMWVAIFGREGARWALGVLGIVIVGVALVSNI